MNSKRNDLAIPTAAAVVLFASAPVWAQDDTARVDELEIRMTALAEEIAMLRTVLDAQEQKNSSADVAALQSEISKATQHAQRAERAASEWKDTTAVTHLAGYAAAGYTNEENGTNSFDVANFNPIFHFQYGDRILWESELEVEVEEDGSTRVALEYSTIDIFLNDYITLIAGKFISPIGNFRQNVHPAWINKLPSAPPGFGHDGAAPLAEVGFQLRGALPFGERSKLTYSGFVGNGPRLEGEAGELHGIDTDGFTGDADDEKVFGGRVSVLPMPKLEIGFSGAFGDAAVVLNNDVDFEGDPSRSYRALGVDAAYQWGNFDFRGEYIQQDVEDEAASVAPEGGQWESWYLQSAYKFAQAKWEGVFRYADYSSPHAEQSQEQLALSLNYLFTPNAIIKLGYEFNEGLNGEPTDNDRWLIQLAYGY